MGCHVVTQNRGGRVVGILLLSLFAPIGWSDEPSANQDVDALELFEPIVRSDTAAMESENDTTLLSREVTARTDLLVKHDRVRLNLLEDVEFVATRTSADQRSATQFSWFGILEDVPDGQVILVVDDDELAGNIYHPDGVYQIRTSSPGEFTIRSQVGIESDPEGPLPSPPSPIVPSSFPDTGVSDPPGQLDVLVLYTADAYGPGIGAEIQLAVDETNRSFLNTGIGHTVRLVGTRLVNYEETGDGSVDLRQLTGRGGAYAAMDEVHAWRDQLCADLVSLWTRYYTNWCGVAWLLESLDASEEAWGFNVVRRDCATAPSYTFAHELGHNLGACHDHYVVPRTCSSTIYDFSYGYVDTYAGWRTIMSYGDECVDVGVYCPVIPYWSNSDTDYGERPMGYPPGSYEAADNKETLRRSALATANFRRISDNDSDSDGVCQGLDNCPSSPNPYQGDADNDSVGDSCDNCPAQQNSAQQDFDLDGMGDSCEYGPERVDANHSGTVDGVDLILLGLAFGSQVGHHAHYSASMDFTRDGWVDGDDLAILTLDFGEETSWGEEEE